MDLTNLIACWEMNDSSGNATDAHSNALTLTANNSPGSATGVLGNCRTFTTASAMTFTRTHEALLDTGNIDFSFTAWVQINTTSTYHVFIGKEQTGSEEYGLFYDQAANKFSFEIRGSVYKAVTASAFGAPSINTWYWLYCYHDATNDLIGISVNNGTINTTATAGSYPGQANNVNATFAIGKRGYTGSELYLGGKMDQVTFWKQLVGTTDRATIYNSGAGASYPWSTGFLPHYMRRSMVGGLNSIGVIQ